MTQECILIVEPPSQKSSRAPSPIPGQKYDALEGQFPGSPQSPNIDGSLVQPSLTHASRSTPPNGTHQVGSLQLCVTLRNISSISFVDVIIFALMVLLFV